MQLPAPLFRSIESDDMTRRARGPPRSVPRSIARRAFFSDRRMAALRARRGGRISGVFDDVDVVVTPGAAMQPSRIGATNAGVQFDVATGERSGVPYSSLESDQPAAAVVPVGLRRRRPAHVEKFQRRPAV